MVRGDAQAAVLEQCGDRRGHRDHREVQQQAPYELDGGVKGKEKKLDFEIRPRRSWSARPQTDPAD